MHKHFPVVVPNKICDCENAGRIEVALHVEKTVVTPWLADLNSH